MKNFLFLLSISFTCNLFGAAVSVCLDPLATNYDSTQDPTVNPGIQILFDNGSLVIDSPSCEYPQVIIGCTDIIYTEYNEVANTDDGSCEVISVTGCTDPQFVEYNPLATLDDGSCSTLKVFGCINILYTEYNAAANTDNGF